MAHAAYSCLHFRGILLDYDLQDAVAIPPMDVYMEVGAAFLSLLIGELMEAGTLQPVEVIGSRKRRQLVAPAYRTRDFDIYENRAKVLNMKSS
eukprot:scaffold25830_cov162-Cylindrotheca_fusiformis.AAC.1